MPRAFVNSFLYRLKSPFPMKLNASFILAIHEKIQFSSQRKSPRRLRSLRRHKSMKKGYVPRACHQLLVLKNSFATKPCALIEAFSQIFRTSNMSDDSKARIIKPHLSSRCIPSAEHLSPIVAHPRALFTFFPRLAPSACRARILVFGIHAPGLIAA